MKEPKLTSNTKPDTTACLGAWYTWDRILQISLEGKALCRYVTLSLSMFRNFDYKKKKRKEKKKKKKEKKIYIYDNLGKELEHDLVATTIKT